MTQPNDLPRLTNPSGPGGLLVGVTMVGIFLQDPKNTNRFGLCRTCPQSAGGLTRCPQLQLQNPRLLVMRPPDVGRGRAEPPHLREDPWGELTIPCPSVFVGTENQSSLPVYGIGSGFPQGGYGRCQEVRGVYHVKTQTFPRGIRWVSLADLTVIHVSVKTARCSSLTCGGYVPAPQYVAKTLL